MALKLSQKAALLIAVPFVINVLVVGVVVASQKKLEAQYRREFKAKDELSVVNSELRVMLEAGTSLAMYHATRDDQFLKRFARCHGDLEKLQKGLLSIPRDERELDLDEFTSSVEEVMASFDKMEALTKSGDRMNLMASVFAGNALAGKISAIGTAILAKANTLTEAQRREEEQRRAWLDIVVFAGVLVDFFVAIGMAIFFQKSTTKRLNVLWRNAANLSKNQALEPSLGGGDEIAAIDASFHEMADAVNRAQERELALTENALDVICSFNGMGVIERANRAAQSLWGISPEELIGHSILELVKASERDTATAIMQRAKEQECKPFEVTMLRADGVEFEVQWALRWSAQEAAFFAVMHDISERKRIERLKQEVLAMVSHDLRSPLTAIDINVSLLQEGRYGNLNEAGGTLLAKLRGMLGRLIGMINTLLDIEKLDSGAIEITYSDQSARRIIDTALETVMALAEAKGIGFATPRNDLTVRCDQDKIASVLVNLVSNAIKFSPPDSVIELQVEQRKDFTEFRVRDQGRGVPPDKRELIFERFKQSEKSDETELKGSGLGLAICKSIVEAHRGTIGVRNVETGGSCFFFRLPV